MKNTKVWGLVRFWGNLAFLALCFPLASFQQNYAKAVLEFLIIASYFGLFNAAISRRLWLLKDDRSYHIEASHYISISSIAGCLIGVFTFKLIDIEFHLAHNLIIALLGILVIYFYIRNYYEEKQLKKALKTASTQDLVS